MPERTDPTARRIPELEALQPDEAGTRADTSPARLYVRANFDALVAARARGVSWDQIAGTMNKAGVRGVDGAEVTWRQIASLFHTERYFRGGRRKRRKVQPKGAQVGTVSPARPEASETPPATPTRSEAARSERLNPEASGPPSPAPSQEAEGLRALLVRRRPDLREPTPINLGPEDRRPRQETDDDA